MLYNSKLLSKQLLCVNIFFLTYTLQWILLESSATGKHHLVECRCCMFICWGHVFIIDSAAAFHTSLHSVIMCMKPDKTEGLDFAQMLWKLLTRLWGFRNRGQHVGACKACLPQMQVFEPHSTGQNSFMFDVCAVGFSLKVAELLCRFSHGADQPEATERRRSRHENKI